MKGPEASFSIIPDSGIDSPHEFMVRQRFHGIVPTNIGHAVHQVSFGKEGPARSYGPEEPLLLLQEACYLRSWIVGVCARAGDICAMRVKQVEKQNERHARQKRLPNRWPKGIKSIGQHED